MYNRELSRVIMVEGRLYHPHASVEIRLVFHKLEPVDEGTGKGLLPVSKRKKTQNPLWELDSDGGISEI